MFLQILCLIWTWKHGSEKVKGSFYESLSNVKKKDNVEKVCPINIIRNDFDIIDLTFTRGRVFEHISERLKSDTKLLMYIELSYKEIKFTEKLGIQIKTRKFQFQTPVYFVIFDYLQYRNCYWV